MDERFEERRHPIGVAAERTGLSPEVIRAWERRYGAVTPARDEAGQRLYSDADVERLSLLSRATAGGRSISQVADLAGRELAELVRGDEEARSARRESGESPELGGTVAELEGRVLALDGAALESRLRRLLVEHGFLGFVESVAAPLLRRLGEGWHEGRVTAAQEHLASACVRRVLESARTEPEGCPSAGPVAVVGTLTGERHEAGVLAAAGAASLAGWRVVYLGAELPVEELAGAVRAAGARAVCVGVTLGSEPKSLVADLRALKAAVGGEVTVYVGGPAVASLREELLGYDVRCPETLAELRSELADEMAEERGKR